MAFLHATAAEAPSLVALGLFISTIAVWSAIICGA